jgi:hypothetical protein
MPVIPSTRPLRVRHFHKSPWPPLSAALVPGPYDPLTCDTESNTATSHRTPWAVHSHSAVTELFTIPHKNHKIWGSQGGDDDVLGCDGTWAMLHRTTGHPPASVLGITTQNNNNNIGIFTEGSHQITRCSSSIQVTTPAETEWPTNRTECSPSTRKSTGLKFLRRNCAQLAPSVFISSIHCTSPQHSSSRQIFVIFLISMSETPKRQLFDNQIPDF